MMLARLARMDPTLLHPIEQPGGPAGYAPAQVARQSDACPSGLDQCGTLYLEKLGYPVSNPSSARFHKLVLNGVPESIREMIAHNVAAIAELTERIKALDTSISRLAAERYPETIYLQQVSGVGPITSLYSSG
jgi:hypothetical protein